MKRLIGMTFGVLLLMGCTAEKTSEVSTSDATATVASTTSTPAATTASAAGEPSTTGEPVTTDSVEAEPGTWAGQVKIAQPVSVFNYVGAESGDFVPMRFDNASEAGKKILAVCGNDDMCEFTGAIEMLDEAPPEDASAVARIVRVDSVKRLPATTP